jgi:UDP-N-acetylmuramoyl-tripeptide--D-alanyl-D-alanine ligase
MKIEEIHSLFLKHPLVSTDTRKIIPDSIFFALKGANFNGNNFAAEAIEKGAAYSIIDETQSTKNEKIILVEDVLKCLQDLATFHRKYLNIPVIGITGSNGKTTTKEILQRVLSKKFNVFATIGNLNNHIGVPLTLLALNKSHEIAIVEMGANHQGEIALLSSICLPNYALITNIGKAHLEGFGGIDGVIKGKTELYKFIRKNNGLLFVNGDDELLMRVSGDIDKITYGQKESNFLVGKLISSQNGLSFSYSTAKATVKVENNVEINSVLNGMYNFQNILAAICIGTYFNIDSKKIKEAIEEYIPQNNRSQIEVRHGITFYMDAYNANPTSLEVAILNFAEMQSENKILIIGKMMELGSTSEMEHARIGRLATSKAFKQVYLIGELYKKAEITGASKLFDTTEEAFSWFTKHPVENATILIKGSRANKMEMLQPLF